MNQITYPYLPKDKAIKYVSAEDQFMKAAKRACGELSTDRKHPTGAVLVKNGKILVRAANQSALKNKQLLKFHQKGWCVRKLLKIPSGQKYWLCPGCASHKNHGEYQAVMALEKKFPQKINSTLDLYLWGHWWC